MNTIQQRVLNEYLAVIREQNALDSPAAGVRERDTARQESPTRPRRPKPPIKGRYIDVVA